MVLTPPALFVSSFVSYSSIKDNSERSYHTKFGSLFGEFKMNKGFLSTQYYTFFFLRRLSYLFAQVYLNDYPHIQIGVHLGFTLLQIGYLVYYVPFKDSHIMISVFSGEFASGIFIIFSVFFLYDVSGNTLLALESVMIYSVITGIGIQFLASIYSFVLAIKVMWNKVLELNAKSFLKTSKGASDISIITTS